ncbi:hypothetical protein ACWGCW_04480 [Streptomyces sp. NPDC054933]
MPLSLDSSQGDHCAVSGGFHGLHHAHCERYAPACNLAHGFRYAAIETDRTGVRPGNEHGIRVNRLGGASPHITSAKELLARRLFLPVLLVGYLPTTEEAQRMSALIKKSHPGDGAALPEHLVDSNGILRTL